MLDGFQECLEEHMIMYTSAALVFGGDITEMVMDFLTSSQQGITHRFNFKHLKQNGNPRNGIIINLPKKTKKIQSIMATV